MFQGLWRDEVDSIRFAGRALSELLKLFASPGQNGPLYFLLLRPWLKLVGEHEFGLRMFSVLFGVLAIPLIFRVASRLQAGRSALGLVAALLAATSPYLVWYSQEGKMYAAVVFMVLLSFDRLLAAAIFGRWHRWLCFVLVTSTAFYLHLTSVLVVPAEVIAFLLLGKTRAAGSGSAFAASLAALTVPYVPLLIWEVPMFSASAQTGYAFVPLPDMLASMLRSFSLGVVANAPWWAVVLVMATLTAGLLLASSELGVSAKGILLSWLAVPTLLFFLITIRRPMYTARYLILVVPALILLLAAGVVQVGRRSRALALVLLLGVLVANGRGLYLQQQRPQKADFRAAVRYVVQDLGPADLILFQMPYGRYSFDYYFSRYERASQASTVVGPNRLFLPLLMGGSRSYRWADGLYTNSGMAEEEVARRMASLVYGSQVVWLVASEAEMWDERGLVKGWLDAHAALTAEATFVRVTVYRYELTQE